MSKHVHRLLSKDLENKTGVCASCGPTRLYVYERARDGLRAACVGGRTKYRSVSKIVRHKMSEKNLELGTAICSVCGPTRIKGSGTSLQCETAHLESYNRQPHGQIKGLTRGEAAELREGRACFICGETDNPQLDHDHSTGRIRGVLCLQCNQGIGKFYDKIELLERAVMYLQNETEFLFSEIS